MSDISTAADSLLQFVEKLKPMQDVAEALKKVGALDQAIAERTQAHVNATQKHSEIQSLIAGAEAELARLDARVKVLLDEAKAECVKLLAAARGEADVIKTNARSDATEIVTVAQRDAANVVAERDAALKSSDAILADTHAKIAEAQTKLSDLTVQHGVVSNAIAELKKTAQTLLG